MNSPIYKISSFKQFTPAVQRIRYLTLEKSPRNIEQKRKELMAKGLPKQKPIEGVKEIVLVASGKGGVGKSTTSVNLAAAIKLNNPKKEVGLLDADVFGPSVPLMMNLNETPFLTKDNLMEPLRNYGIKCMSMGFLIGKGAAVIWRGLMVMQALEKLMRQVHWGETDYLIIDTPPGTGDTHLSLLQNLPINGVLLVTTPQNAALEVTKRGATMFKKLNVPLIGIVENMNYVKCNSCSNKIEIFGNGTEELARELSCDILGRFPLNQEISISTDNGTPIVVKDKSNEISQSYQQLAKKVVDILENNKVKII